MSLADRLRGLLGAGREGEDHPEGEKGCPECSALSCMEALARIQEYLDGELAEEEHRDVAHHFEVCQRCYPHLRLEERFREALRHAREGEAAPDHLKAQIYELLSSEAREGG